MKIKTPYIIALAIIGIVSILIFSIFEIRDIPDLDWKENYKIENKDPYGLYLFDQLVRQSFPLSKIVYFSEYIKDPCDTELLYIRIAPDANSFTAEYNSLIEVIENGNDLLYIAEWINSTIDSISEDNYYIDYTYSDTIVSFNFTNEQLFDSTSYVYSHFISEFDEIKPLSYGYYEYYEDTLLDIINIVSIDQEELPIYAYVDVNEGRIFQHTIPVLFTNQSLRQPRMAEYARKCLSYFQPKIIVLDDSKDIQEYKQNASNPLQFILTQKPLRWALNLLVMSGLLYVLFRSKRTQKAIPIITKNNNNSIDYVKTLGQLYNSQKKHNLIINHMETLFYKRMAERYFIKKTDPFFAQNLSRKSKIDKREIEIIIKRFKEVATSNKLNEYDLQNFDFTLDRFYNKCI